MSIITPLSCWLVLRLEQQKVGQLHDLALPANFLCIPLSSGEGVQAGSQREHFVLSHVLSVSIAVPISSNPASTTATSLTFYARR